MKVYKCFADFELVDNEKDKIKQYSKNEYYSLDGIPVNYYENFIDKSKNININEDIINEDTLNKFGNSKNLILG